MVIRSIRHKGLRRFHATGSTAGIQAPHARKLCLQLAALDSATTIADMDIPGFRLHALVGPMRTTTDERHRPHAQTTPSG